MSHGGYTDRDGKHRHSYHHSVITVPLNTAGLSCVIFISQDTRATFTCPEGASFIKTINFFQHLLQPERGSYCKYAEELINRNNPGNIRSVTSFSNIHRTRWLSWCQVMMSAFIIHHFAEVILCLLCTFANVGADECTTCPEQEMANTVYIS